MKIPASIRALYEDQFASYERLKKRVDSLLDTRLHERWHYESRIKSEESFTLKIETGRIENVKAVEDFFAATIVVRNSLEISDAETLVRNLFDLDTRKPLVDQETFKAPDEFPFDDLRLHVRWKDDPALPPTGLSGTLFEIQVKTFLQHAWSIATHDLTYKTNDADWGKMRIAYQIKAMLEHAELSIQEASALSASSALSKSDARTTAIKEYITLICSLWAKEDLPADVRRLAENVMSLAKLVGIGAPDLKSLLEEAKTEGKGPLIRNLTPYGIVVQTLLEKKRIEFSAGLKRQSGMDPRRRRPVVLTKELELPAEAQTDIWKNATIWVGLNTEGTA